MLTILLTLLACMCKREGDLIGCPEGARASTMNSYLCTCDVDESGTTGAFMVSSHGGQTGLPCAACDPHLQGLYQGWDMGMVNTGTDWACVCEDGSILFADESVCVACPTDCSALECVPDGCEGACGEARGCSEGSTCDANGTCVPCDEDMCGGACGSCPGDRICEQNRCVDLAICCLNDNIGDACSMNLSWCYVYADPSIPAAAGYYCECPRTYYNQYYSCVASESSGIYGGFPGVVGADGTCE